MEAAGYFNTLVPVYQTTSQEAAGVIFNTVRTADLSVLPNITSMDSFGSGWVTGTLVHTAINFSAP
jgi:hypothetical protein